MFHHACRLLGLSMVLAAAPSAFADVRINELRIDQPGADNDEYVELAGAPGDDLTGLAYIVIGDGTGGGGVIESVTRLSGSVGASGYHVLAEGTFSLGTADVTGTLNFENSDNVTHLLVAGFTGADGDDLDSNDDGVLDVEPWEAVLDSVALVETPDSGEPVYGDTLVGPDGTFVPGHVRRCPDGSGDFAIGKFDLTESDDSPGAFNDCTLGEIAVEVLINELRIDQPGSDNDEYLELAAAPGTSLTGLTYLVIGDGTGGSGVIEAVVDLEGATVGETGLFVAAEGTFTLGTADLTTSLNFENSDNVTHLLVAGFSGANGDDLDSNDDGVLDVEPWEALLDSVALVETPDSGEQVYGDTRVGPDGNFVPGHVYRCGAGFEIGGFDPASGVDSPGLPNSACPGAVINEIRIDQPGGDNDEYFELAGAPGLALDGFTYLVIGDGTGGSGVIEAVVDLGAAVIGSNGLFVAAEGTFTLGSADLVTSLNFENSDNVTHLLVQGFTGANGDDLDSNDDGVLDSTPWSAVVDSVALVEDLTSGEQVYSDTRVGPDGSFVPGHVYRCASGFVIGGFNPADGTDTPGLPNGCDGNGGGGDVVDAFIHAIQGSGATAAITGDVRVQAIVTGLFEDNDALNGFYLQEEDADADADPATSEALFVFCGDCPTAVSVGDQVTVVGVAGEFNGTTQVNSTSGSVSIDAVQQPLPAAVAVPLPAAGSTGDEATFEALESMLVTFPDELVVSEYFELARFGQLVLTLDDRPVQFTQLNAPDATALAAFEADLATRRIVLDDNNGDQNDATTGEVDEPYAWPQGGLSVDNRFRGGDSITGLTGVFTYAFGAWRVRPVPEAFDYAFDSLNPRPAAPDPVGGRLKVASFNVLNYFSTIDEPGAVCGPGADAQNNPGCRGADSVQELERQQAKIVAALAGLDADVVGLVEIENDSGAAVNQLVAALNTVVGEGLWAAVDSGIAGTDSIRVALIHRTDTLAEAGAPALLTSAVDPRFDDGRNRPALAQSFRELATGAEFTVVVNHLKSKGSSCGAGDDSDNGQGNCNATRTQAAEALADWLATAPTGNADPDVLVIGDLNAYALEDPVQALVSAGYTDLVRLFEGADADGYVFDGRVGYLDHALANPALLEQVSGVTTWHINADEPSLFDYNDTVQDPSEASFERKSTALPVYAADPFRSSDHDPLLVGLDLTIPVAQDIASLRAEFVDGVINGDLAGAHPRRFVARVQVRIIAIRLLVAEILEARGRTRAACAQLRLVDRLAGADARRPWLQGNGLTSFQDGLTAVRGNLGCR